MRKVFAYTILLLTLLSSCSAPERKYRIGVSQCSDDIWRDKQNQELRMGAYFHRNVDLCFAAAYDSDMRQVQQIDSLVGEGIDLLIVAPNQVATISPAIDRAYDKGIPVIVFERKTNSRKYTAFISADNYEMGRVMGDYVASRLHGQGRIMEVKGLEGSSPAIERHNGFADALSQHKNVDVVATLQGDWTEPTAYQKVRQWLAVNEDAKVDLVFGMNDRSAMGARKAFIDAGVNLPLFCGIDGLPGDSGGIKLVRDSLLDASYIYPTHGDQLLEQALNILEGKPYEKETHLMSALVTRENARVLQMESDEIVRQSQNIAQLQQVASRYLQQLDTQRTVTLLACGVIVLLLLVMVLFYFYHRSKINLQRQRVVNNLWNLEAPEAVAEVKDEPTPAAVSQLPEAAPAETPAAPAPEKESVETVDTSLFITRFKEVVESRLSDSELSVEELAADMNLSRVQLYRKVKAISGQSPVELLRTARLNRAYQLLVTTEKTVSEVAYQIGFSAPSYFTKCFKDEFGMLPGDVRSKG